MKIIKVELVPVVMVREDPEWRHALSRPGGEPDVRGFIVKLIADNGLIGLGYNHGISHYGVSYGKLQAALEAYKPLLVGRDPFDTENIFIQLESRLRGNDEARTAIDVALHDLQAKVLGVPLYYLLGGLVRREIPIIRIVSLKEPAQMVGNALKLVEQGYSYLKVKLNGDSEKDLSRVKEIRQAVGNKIHLIVDANQSYSPKAAISALKQMLEYGIEICEQPVVKNDWRGLAAVTQAVDCSIEAHESAETLEDIMALVNNKICDSINLSINQLGGLRNAKTAAAICALGNVKLRIQAMGSRLLSAACMHLVASTENISYACELGEFSRLLNDPVEGLEVENGTLKVPLSHGVGVSLCDK